MIRDAIGLDIGGANLKIATASGRAITRPFELWKHPAQLAAELTRLASEFPADLPLAVTMTGELCDCFETKRDGVRHILAAVGKVFPEDRIRVWSTEGRFLNIDDARQAAFRVAAANWHGLATFACRLVGSESAILLDIGSTTTDIIPLNGGKPIPKGLTDFDRMNVSELVYTGASRTPVCAVVPSCYEIPSVASELFATMRDVYLLLGMIPDDPDDSGTADGRSATRRYAHARLARMLGGDAESTTVEATLALASRASLAQAILIGWALANVYRTLPTPASKIVLSGSGEFIGRIVAHTPFPRHFREGRAGVGRRFRPRDAGHIA